MAQDKDHPTVVPIDADFTRRFNQAFSFGFYLERPGDNRSIADIRGDATSYIELSLNPQRYSMTDVAATSIQFAQGGGKIIESRGGVIKDIVIAGTTGFLPSVRGSRINAGNTALTETDLRTMGQRSGFEEFHRLRNIFRTFLDERRKGKQINLHFMNFKDDEFWRIEPTKFDLQREARRGLRYNYSIIMRGIDPSELQPASLSLADDPSLNALADVKPATVSVSRSSAPVSTTSKAPPATRVHRSIVQTSPAMAQSVTRLGDIRHALLSAVGRYSLFVQQRVQGMLDYVNQVVAFFSDTKTAAHLIYSDLPMSLLKQMTGSINAVFDTFDDSMPDDLKRDMNDTCLELLEIAYSTAAHYQATFGIDGGFTWTQKADDFLYRRGIQGASDTNIPDVAGSTGSLANNPFLGQSGLGLISDVQALANVKSYVSESILQGDTIYSIAQRVMGNVHQFMVLVILNNLEAPYIVEDPNNRPPHTLAWGDKILVPDITATTSAPEATIPDVGVSSFTSIATAGSTMFSIVDTAQAWRPGQLIGFTLSLLTGAGIGDRVIVDNTETTITVGRAFDGLPVSGDDYRVELDLFTLRRASTPEEDSYGTDILVVFVRSDNGVMTGTVRFNALGDLATVSGYENFSQAITILLNTERGRNMFHPTYGLGMPIGSSIDATVAPLYTYFVRQSLYSDPRVDKVINPKFQFAGGATMFSVGVRPLNAGEAKTFSLPL